eukprot:gene10764-11960_t
MKIRSHRSRQQSFGGEAVNSLKTEATFNPLMMTEEAGCFSNDNDADKQRGIPMGLSASIPLLLMDKGSSYESLSLFSLVSIPFSLKIFWAPIVDTYYWPSFGRRKSWLIPVQLLTGLTMILCSSLVESWLNEKDYISPRSESVGAKSLGKEVAMLPLTAFFLLLYFLMATQDIAVDGWALTMLDGHNVGYSSVANSIGQSLGIFLSNQGFLALSDEMWCKRFLGMPPVISLSGFISFWGYVFLLTTVFICFFKKESEIQEKEETSASVIQTLRHITSLFKLKTVTIFCVILFTCKAPFASVDAAFIFKLHEYGLTKSDLATISPMLLLTSLLFPALMSSQVARHPLRMFLLGLKLKMGTSLLLWCVFEFTATFDQFRNPVYYSCLTVVLLANECAGCLSFTSCMAFFSRVSDPSIGGSYMTLLNTVTNLGAKWPAVLALYLLPKLTFYHSDRELGSSSIAVDGLTLLTIFGSIGGLMWLYIFQPILIQLQTCPIEHWRANNEAAAAKSF